MAKAPCFPLMLRPLFSSSSLLRRLASPQPAVAGFTSVFSRQYHENVVDHYENPRNVGARRILSFWVPPLRPPAPRRSFEQLLGVLCMFVLFVLK